MRYMRWKTFITLKNRSQDYLKNSVHVKNNLSLFSFCTEGVPKPLHKIQKKSNPIQIAEDTLTVEKLPQYYVKHYRYIKNDLSLFCFCVEEVLKPSHNIQKSPIKYTRRKIPEIKNSLPQSLKKILHLSKIICCFFLSAQRKFRESNTR